MRLKEAQEYTKRELLEAIAARLTLREVRALLLRAQGYGHADVAKQMKTTPSAVNALLGAARRKLEYYSVSDALEDVQRFRLEYDEPRDLSNEKRQRAARGEGVVHIPRRVRDLDKAGYAWVFRHTRITPMLAPDAREKCPPGHALVWQGHKFYFVPVAEYQKLRKLAGR